MRDSPAKWLIQQPLHRGIARAQGFVVTTRNTTMQTKNVFTTIDRSLLQTVGGGASRVTSRSGSNDQLQLMLTQITSSIKDMANGGNNSMNQMLPLLLMMMGGGGGGAAAPAPAPAYAAAPPPPPPAPTIRISNRVRA
jgi:hypothetical protein